MERVTKYATLNYNYHLQNPNKMVAILQRAVFCFQILNNDAIEEYKTTEVFQHT